VSLAADLRALLAMAATRLDRGDVAGARAAIALVLSEVGTDAPAPVATDATGPKFGLVDAAQLASILGVAVRTIQARRDDYPTGSIVHIGRAVRYDADRILEALRSSDAAPVASAAVAEDGAAWARRRAGIRVVRS